MHLIYKVKSGNFYSKKTLQNNLSVQKCTQNRTVVSEFGHYLFFIIIDYQHFKSLARFLLYIKVESTHKKVWIEQYLKKNKEKSSLSA